MSATSIVILCVAGYLAWLVSTLGGGGGGMLLIPVITYVKELGSRAVAPVLAVVTMVDSPMRVYLFRRHIDWKIVRWYLPGAVSGAFLGSVVFVKTEAHWLKVLAALFLLSTSCSSASAMRRARSRCARGGSCRSASSCRSSPG